MARQQVVLKDGMSAQRLQNGTDAHRTIIAHYRAPYDAVFVGEEFVSQLFAYAYLVIKMSESVITCNQWKLKNFC